MTFGGHPHSIPPGSLSGCSDGPGARCGRRVHYFNTIDRRHLIASPGSTCCAGEHVEVVRGGRSRMTGFYGAHSPTWRHKKHSAAVVPVKQFLAP
jgi:hypothetical protein